MSDLPMHMRSGNFTLCGKMWNGVKCIIRTTDDIGEVTCQNCMDEYELIEDGY